MAFFDIFKKKQDNSAAQASEERKQQQEELNAGLEKTKTGLFSKLARAVAGRSTVDADVLDDLEEVLISSDVGVETTVKIIRGIEERVARDKYMGTSELQSILREEVTALMEESHGSEKHFGLDAKEGEPYVVMVVGVNGAGKTTTIGKLAAQLTKAGQKVWIGAADTFRAAAIDQLKVWADRAGATMIRQEMGSDHSFAFFDRDPLPAYGSNPFSEFYRRLTALRHANPALASGERGGEMIEIRNNAEDCLMIAVREAEGNRVVAVMNLSPYAIHADYYTGIYAGMYTDAMTGRPGELRGHVEEDMAPWSYRILTR